MHHIKSHLARYCHFPSTSYCAVINRPLSYGTAIKENKKESATYVNVHKNWQIIKFILISVIINNRYHSNPLLFYWRDIYFWVFSRCDTCDVSGSFHVGIIEVMNTYFIWYFDKNVPGYKLIIPLCIQSAFKIVIKIVKLPEDCLFEII